MKILSDFINLHEESNNNQDIFEKIVCSGTLTISKTAATAIDVECSGTLIIGK